MSLPKEQQAAAEHFYEQLVDNVATRLEDERHTQLDPDLVAKVVKEEADKLHFNENDGVGHEFTVKDLDACESYVEDNFSSCEYCSTHYDVNGDGGASYSFGDESLSICFSCKEG